ncbi:MAG: hypothetical protein ACLRI7_10285 [Ruthenibacterium lactatiformans]
MQHRLDAGSGRLERGHVRDMGGSMAAERDAGDDRGRQVLPHRYLAFALSQQSVYFGLSGKAFGWFDLDQWHLEGRLCA